MWRCTEIRIIARNKPRARRLTWQMYYTIDWFFAFLNFFEKTVIKSVRNSFGREYKTFRTTVVFRQTPDDVENCGNSSLFSRFYRLHCFLSRFARSLSCSGTFSLFEWRFSSGRHAKFFVVPYCRAIPLFTCKWKFFSSPCREREESHAAC